MMKSELHKFLVYYAEQPTELHSVLSAALPKNDEGFVIYDGSDLSDALQGLEQMATALTRMAFKVSRDKPSHGESLAE